MPTRKATGLEGVLPVDKPAGMTSHDVVAAVRRASGERRIGHAGTLDPLATGLLVLLIGPYTRLEPYLSKSVKRYRAVVRFGVATDTDDAEGNVVEESPVPDDIFDEGFADEQVAALVGVHEQVPPVYSAIKRGGVTAHRAARAGAPIALEPRPIEIFEARLLRLLPEERSWEIDLAVSAGTYVRAIARDLGRSLGTCAHLAALTRTASGNLSLDDAHPLDECVTAASEGRLADLFVDPFRALGLPIVDADAPAVLAGRQLPAPPGSEPLYAVRAEGRLAAVYRREATRLAPQAVFPKAGSR
ncbi:MAG: tRNA pseudouridine(55) synthase TruB [Anaerosomatales bacterium]|nr:tRNA pseudouridine(55) synthase TruB [Anaerosomatales bacterium]